MRRLEPLIARFADNVLKVLRHATLEQLAELLDRAEPPPRSAAARRRKKRAAHRTMPRKRHAIPSVLVAASPEQEITDPEALLAVVARGPKEAPGTATTSTRALPEAAPPPTALESTEQLAQAAVTPRLHAGEWILRASNAGLVIRRAKAAPLG